MSAEALPAVQVEAQVTYRQCHWCHARVSAQGFYRRHGFRPRSAVLYDPVAGAQVIMSLSLAEGAEGP